ncbi:hypothetical protein D3C87_2150170 [compost metagenome]
MGGVFWLAAAASVTVATLSTSVEMFWSASSCTVKLMVRVPSEALPEWLKVRLLMISAARSAGVFR